ncbi:uncharacterized protein CTRU02_211873 [Colletotrichum truncatum]|uniref:Uncharacterized protein n=1 Tax=Colletotrichum truncatum TaxID=5467 RepID=A0ACC3YLX8_COLTU|nr:uncharacterized protein CTRU02_07283 [Colletotrichum truncatum]KAF6791521.1 hypothetical protein CTRU02_07283 [Colletotrichum truncatum]
MFETGRYGQTPLHVAIFWPRGLELLFELAEDACHDIIDALDSTETSAITYAITLQQAESVTILLKKHATIDLENTACFFGHKFSNYLNAQSREVCEVLSKELAKRRTEMLHYALEHLPEKQATRLGLANMAMLQENAFDVVTELKNYGVPIPRQYKLIRRGSIYHTAFMSVNLAEALFESGFTNIDSIVDGYTPLMVFPLLLTFGTGKTATSDLIAWFDKKQADVKIPIPIEARIQASCIQAPEYRVIHRLSYMLGLETGVTSLSGLHFSLQVRKLFSVSSKDPCLCYCAPEGCNSASLFARGWLWYPESEYGFGTKRLVEWNEKSLHEMSYQGLGTKCAFVRVCTFSRLGMHHTCCVHRIHDQGTILRERGRFAKLISIMETEEVAEIRNEDRYLAVTLEKLMEEFSSKLRNDTLSFLEFMKFWNNRMCEFESEKEQIAAEDLQTMLDIGVRFDNI